MPVDLGDVNLNVPAADWRVAVFLVVAAVAATAFFALMPALQATRDRPGADAARRAGEGRAARTRAQRADWRAGLRVGAAADLRRDLSAQRDRLVAIRSGFSHRRYGVDRHQQRAEARRDDPGDADRPDDHRIRGRQAAVAGPAARRVCRHRRRQDAGGATSPSRPAYFDVLGIPIVRGRAFTAAERDDHPVAIVSESVARALWPNGDGVGETFRLEPDLASRPERTPEINPDAADDEALMQPRMVTVVGVSRDVPGFRFTDVKEAGVFLPTSLDVAKTSVVARVQGDPDLARQTLLDHLTRIDPNMGMIITMRTVARLETFFLQIAFWVSLILGGLALLLTVSGLFSVLSYLVEQRTKEIGVRMALGASSQKVTQLMLAQTTRPVMYGLIAGAGLAASARDRGARHAGRRADRARSCTSPIRWPMPRA